MSEGDKPKLEIYLIVAYKSLGNFSNRLSSTQFNALLKRAHIKPLTPLSSFENKWGLPGPFDPDYQGRANSLIVKATEQRFYLVQSCRAYNMEIDRSLGSFRQTSQYIDLPISDLFTGSENFLYYITETGVLEVGSPSGACGVSWNHEISRDAVKWNSHHEKSGFRFVREWDSLVVVTRSQVVAFPERQFRDKIDLRITNGKLDPKKMWIQSKAGVQFIVLVELSRQERWSWGTSFSLSKRFFVSSNGGWVKVKQVIFKGNLPFKLEQKRYAQLKTTPTESEKSIVFKSFGHNDRYLIAAQEKSSLLVQTLDAAYDSYLVRLYSLPALQVLGHDVHIPIQRLGVRFGGNANFSQPPSTFHFIETQTYTAVISMGRSSTVDLFIIHRNSLHHLQTNPIFSSCYSQLGSVVFQREKREILMYLFNDWKVVSVKITM